MTISFDGIYIFILVFARMAGFILFNPFLSRNNVPPPVRAGLVLLITLLLSPVIDSSHLNIASFDMLLGMFREFFMGFACGFVYQIFYFLLLFAGDIMDTEFGMAMAKVFDPSTNIQVSLSGSIITMLFMLYILMTDSHLVMIQMYALSFELVPLGAVNVSTELYRLMLTMFVDVFSLAMRLLLPFVVMEFLLQVVLGIMMKLVPQIHIFVINFQMKQGLGLILLFAMCPVIAAYLDNYIVIMLENMQRALLVLA